MASTDSVDMSLSKLRESEGQGSLASRSPWDCTELDTPERLSSSMITLPAETFHQASFSCKELASSKIIFNIMV